MLPDGSRMVRTIYSTDLLGLICTAQIPHVDTRPYPLDRTASLSL